MGSGLVQHVLGLTRSTLQKGDAGGPQGPLGPSGGVETAGGRVEAVGTLPGGMRIRDVHSHTPWLRVFAASEQSKTIHCALIDAVVMQSSPSICIPYPGRW